MVDTLDYEIVNAVQISPRISWTQLSGIVQADVSTLSRRWKNLVDSRLVWTTCFFMESPATVVDPGLALPRRRAIVEVDCYPGKREETIREVTALPQVTSAYTTSGDRDLYLLVTAADLLTMDRYVDALGTTVPGIARTRTHHIRRRFKDGTEYRIPALSADQAAAVRRTLPDTPRRTTPNPATVALIDALSGDVRLPVSEISACTGRSASSVSRGIEALLQAEWVRWRVDFAYNLMGWEGSALLWMAVPPAEMTGVAGCLAGMPQVRMCSSVTGRANLVASLWLRTLEELDVVESRLSREFPRAHILDRWVVPRALKRVGHVFDADGRWQRYVPFDTPELLEA